MRRYGYFTLILVTQAVIGFGAAHQSRPAFAYGLQDSQKTVFFSVLDDMPIVPGAVEIESGSFTFDKIDGRITEVTAAAPHISQKAIVQFYAETLPALGWTQASNAPEFRRNNECLSLFVDKNGDMTEYRLRMAPCGS